MKGFLVLFLLIALVSFALADEDVQVRVAAPDFTSKYAEMAAPLPSNIDVNGLVSSLLRFGGGN